MPDYGLRLTLGGAPNTPHHFPVWREGDSQIYGLFQPHKPTPVGEGHLISLERAEQLDQDPATPLELVELEHGVTDQLKADHDAAVAAGHEAAKKLVINSPAQGGAVTEDEAELARDEMLATQTPTENE